VQRSGQFVSIGIKVKVELTIQRKLLLYHVMGRWQINYKSRLVYNLPYPICFCQGDRADLLAFYQTVPPDS
jgi:hypothetical protein